MFCLHHDEAELFGTEAVPCPLCGFGEPDRAPLGHPGLALVRAQDARDALAAVRDLADEPAVEGGRLRLELPRHYW